VIVAALYAARSLIRGSWRPEMPVDALVLFMVVVVMVLVARLRVMASEPDDLDETTDEPGSSHTEAEGPGL
jgi:ABC-type enterobactin transport system permease subunit